MKRTLLALAVAAAGFGILTIGAAPALCADETCYMGGTAIKAETDKDKALDWAKDLRKVAVTGADSDAWQVLTLSRTEEDIAVVVAPGVVFFGVAGKGGEMDARDAAKVFGNDLRKLREAVKKMAGDLRDAGVLKIEGGDVQKLSDAAGLGILEKGRDWELKTQECQAVEVDASAL